MIKSEPGAQGLKSQGCAFGAGCKWHVRPAGAMYHKPQPPMPAPSLVPGGSAVGAKAPPMPGFPSGAWMMPPPPPPGEESAQPRRALAFHF